MKSFSFRARLIAILAIAVLALALGGCASSPRPAESFYAVGSNGAVRPTVQAAVDPAPPSGPFEIIGVNIPIGNPMDPMFAIKGGVLWYGQPGTITIPVPLDQQAQVLQVPQASAGCSGAQSSGVVMVPQNRTVLTPHVLVPVPQPQATQPCR